jgi:hypothetical protein
MSETSSVAVPSSSYVARHWRGELSLPKSYWLNGLVIGLVCRIVFTGLLTGIAFAAASMPWLVLVFILVVALNIAIVVWIIVGIWRSAGRYTGPRIWGILARVVVAIGVVADIMIEINNFAGLGAVMSSGG